MCVCHCLRARGNIVERAGSTFVGKVEQIYVNGEYSGKAILVANDPRWIVVLSVLKADKGVEAETKTLTYFIHSPTELFAMPSDEAKGKEFKFVESLITLPGGKSPFRRLEATFGDWAKKN